MGVQDYRALLGEVMVLQFETVLFEKQPRQFFAGKTLRNGHLLKNSSASNLEPAKKPKPKL